MKLLSGKNLDGSTFKVVVKAPSKRLGRSNHKWTAEEDLALVNAAYLQNAHKPTITAHKSTNGGGMTIQEKYESVVKNTGELNGLSWKQAKDHVDKLLKEKIHTWDKTNMSDKGDPNELNDLDSALYNIYKDLKETNNAKDDFLVEQNAGSKRKAYNENQLLLTMSEDKNNRLPATTPSSGGNSSLASSGGGSRSSSSGSSNADASRFSNFSEDFATLTKQLAEEEKKERLAREESAKKAEHDAQRRHETMIQALHVQHQQQVQSQNVTITSISNMGNMITANANQNNQQLIAALTNIMQNKNY